ncbi:MAG TPA: tetratricopeptide repeat protein [Candidatus Polarisedimenticolia bacterium]|nr:tetratricopeptide repeat protein [Candidatus Polarisedimenticolia bacterium]
MTGAANASGAASLLDTRHFKAAATVLVIGATALAGAALAHRAVSYQRGVRGAALFGEGDPATAYPYLVNAARASLLGRLNASPCRDLAELAVWSLDDARFRRYHPQLPPAAAAKLAFHCYAAALVRRPVSTGAMAGMADLFRRAALIRSGPPVPTLADVAPPDGPPAPPEPAPESRLVTAAYLKAIEMEPSNYFWYAYLADHHREQGRRAEALPLYAKAIELMPDLSWHYYLAGTGPLPEDLFRTVKSGLEAALQRTRVARPDKIEAGLASVFERQRDFDNALLHYRRAIESAPDPSRHLFQTGSLLTSLGRRDEALEYLQRALARGGLNMRQEVSALILVGRMLLDKGRAREAVEALSRARTLDPTSYAARLDLGRASQALGDPDRAEAELRHAVSLDPTSAQAYTLLIALHRQRGQAARAIPLARRLVEMYPEDEKARAQLEALYREMGSSPAGPEDGPDPSRKE